MTLEEFLENNVHGDNPDCPECGSEGEHMRGIEYRCTASSQKCQVLYWFDYNNNVVND